MFDGILKASGFFEQQTILYRKNNDMNSLTRWQRPELSTWPSFGRLTNLRDELDRLFESPLSELARTSQWLSGWTAVLDLYEDKDNLFVKMDLPGMKREEIDVSLHEGSLSISGERKSEQKHEDAEVYRAERFFGRTWIVECQCRRAVIADDLHQRGEIAPLKAYEEHVLRYNGRILVDDAHGVGVAGPTGKGSPEHERLGPESYVLAGTLSKGFGVYGGIVPGSRELIERIRRDSAAFIGSTSLPIPVAAAAARSVRWLRDNDHLVPELQQTSIELKTRLRALGFDIPDAPTPIVSVTFLDQERNAVLRDRLLAHGVYPPFINYPGAPPGGHFRFALSSAHTDEEIETLYDAIASACD